MDADTRGRPEIGWSEPLWNRQVGESDRAFAAFTLYRDFGPARSTQQVAQAVSKSAPFIRRWSARWAWVQRAGAWDDECDRNQRERDLVERQEARRKMLDTHARHGAALVSVGASVLALYDTSDPATAEAAQARIDRLTVMEAARLMVLGSDLERRARGADLIDSREAQQWVAGFIDLALEHLPRDSHESFLTDVDTRLGIG